MADSCRFYSYEGGLFSSGDYCSVTGKKERVTSDYYNKYCKHDYNRRDCPLHKKYGPYESSGACFITTVIHEILNNPDNCKVLNDFREFRKNVLKTNPRYFEGLKQYDNIGPLVAKNLKEDENAEKMAERIYKYHLLKVRKYYLEGNYDAAYTCYCQMTIALINWYGLEEEYEIIKAKDYGYTENNQFNPEIAAHGIGTGIAKEFINSKVKVRKKNTKLYE